MVEVSLEPHPQIGLGTSSSLKLYKILTHLQLIAK